MRAARAARFSTVPAQDPGLSKETRGLPGATHRRAARAVSVPALSVATIMVEKPGVIRRAEAPAWVVEDFTAGVGADRTAAAGIINRSLVDLLVDREI